MSRESNWSRRIPRFSIAGMWLLLRSSSSSPHALVAYGLARTSSVSMRGMMSRARVRVRVYVRVCVLRGPVSPTAALHKACVRVGCWCVHL